MSDIGPTSERPQESSPAAQRLGRFTAANMLRSLLPLVIIILLVAGWVALRQDRDAAVHEIDPATTVALAAARAEYAVVAPDGLPEGYRPTSARTDAGHAAEGDPVTLEIGYLTPSEEYAGFVVSDDAESVPVHDVLDGVREDGAVQLGGTSWARGTTERGEAVLFREEGGVTVLVTGSARDEELETVAAAVRPYSG